MRYMIISPVHLLNCSPVQSLSVLDSWLLALCQYDAHTRHTRRVKFPDAALALEAELESIAAIDRLKILSWVILFVGRHTFEQNHRRAGRDAEQLPLVVVRDCGFECLAGAFEAQAAVLLQHCVQRLCGQIGALQRRTQPGGYGNCL